MRAIAMTNTSECARLLLIPEDQGSILHLIDFDKVVEEYGRMLGIKPAYKPEGGPSDSDPCHQ